VATQHVDEVRRHAPQMDRPYRIWLYPIPCLIALVGWIFAQPVL
jgi:hypothetical protein